MKMTKEEKELREWLDEILCGDVINADNQKRIKTAIKINLTAMRRAILEECAKVGDGYAEIYRKMKNPKLIDKARMWDAEGIAAAIRGMK